MALEIVIDKRQETRNRAIECIERYNILPTSCVVTVSLLMPSEHLIETIRVDLLNIALQSLIVVDNYWIPLHPGFWFGPDFLISISLSH